MMKRVVMLLAFASACTATDSPDAQSAAQPRCEEPQTIAALPSVLREASGLAVSRRFPDILWSHNDSGEPTLFALDTLGDLRGAVTVDAPNNDWEDIAAGACGPDDCLYIGAIGDNRQNRSDRAVLRVREPQPGTRAAVDATYRYRLPDGPQDVEALFVLPGERIFIVSKGRRGPVTLFAFPEPPSATGINTLTAVQTLTPGLVQLPDMITGAGATPDGKLVVLRSYSELHLYRFDGQLRTVLDTAGIDLKTLSEVQGEGVDVGANGTVYLVSEKGLGNEAPALSRVQCTLAQ